MARAHDFSALAPATGDFRAVMSANILHRIQASFYPEHRHIHTIDIDYHMLTFGQGGITHHIYPLAHT
jgi:hypothetical protein